jgi:hypothetical protein
MISAELGHPDISVQLQLDADKRGERGSPFYLIHLRVFPRSSASRPSPPQFNFNWTRINAENAEIFLFNSLPRFSALVGVLLKSVWAAANHVIIITDKTPGVSKNCFSHSELMFARVLAQGNTLENPWGLPRNPCFWVDKMKRLMYIRVRFKLKFG